MTVQSKVIAQKSFTIFFPCILPCIAKKIRSTISGQVSDLAQMSNGPKFKKYHKSKGLQPWGETCSKTTHSNALRHHVKMVELLGWFVRTVQLNIGSRLEQSKYSCANSNLFVKEIGNAQNYTFLLFRQFLTGACLWEKLWCRARTHQALLLTGSFD